jgi:ankyrin repeat protein
MLDANPDLLNSLEDQGPILHEAILHGQLHMVEYLLARGADPNLKNAQGDTALSLARKATQGLTNPSRLQQHPDIVAPLQKHGAVL